MAEKVFDQEHPIERLMSTAVSRLKTLIDTDTIIGSAVTTPEGDTIIPVSKVTLGFVTGGGEYDAAASKRIDEYPFAGGSGAGVSVTPIGFLVSGKNGFKMVSINGDTPYTKILEMVPKLISSFTKCDDKGK